MGAADLSDLFTDKPDFAPYSAKETDPSLFDPVKALTPMDAEFNWKALEENSYMDHPQQMLDDSKELDERMQREGKKKQK